MMNKGIFLHSERKYKYFLQSLQSLLQCWTKKERYWSYKVTTPGPNGKVSSSSYKEEEFHFPNLDIKCFSSLVYWKMRIYIVFNEIVGLLFREGKSQDLGKRDISTLSLFMKYIPEYAEYVWNHLSISEILGEREKRRKEGRKEGRRERNKEEKKRKKEIERQIEVTKNWAAAVWLESLKGWAGQANPQASRWARESILGDSVFLYKNPIIPFWRKYTFLKT